MTGKVAIASAITVVVLVLTCSLSPVICSNADDGSSALDTDDTLKYVSLGDSTTAGYGLPGYTSNTRGFMTDIEETYTYLFTQYLEEQTGKTVDHVQLAISGCRLVDLRAFLYLSDFEGECSCPGDSTTYEVYANGGRNACSYDIVFEKEEYKDIAEKYGVTDPSSGVEGEFDMAKFSMLGEVYQRELADADIITICPNIDLAYAALDLMYVMEGSAPHNL